MRPSRALATLLGVGVGAGLGFTAALAWNPAAALQMLVVSSLVIAVVGGVIGARFA
jgi:hypothetical protein